MMRPAPAITAPCTTETDAAQTEHGDGGAGMHLGRVQHRPDAGRDAAAEQADLVERRVAANLGQRDLGHDGVLGKGRRAHVVVQHVRPLCDRRLRPSGMRPLPCVARSAPHRLV